MIGTMLLAGATIGAIDDAGPPPVDVSASPAPERPAQHDDPEPAAARVEAAERTARASVRTPNPAKRPESRDDVTDAGFPRVAGCDATVAPKGSVANGRLDREAHLCPIGEHHLLRPDAAAAFVAMNAAYLEDTGHHLCVTDSYRSLDQQYSLKARKPFLAATPGTSNHGWGIALDLSCGAETFGGAAHRWLEQHGADYGWVNPAWARPNGSKPEPWHWEYRPGLL
ncbi:MAG: M15 family metallopeptidase [Actinomycetota bacterium]